MTTQDERNKQARAHREEKAFITQEAVRLDAAASTLRKAIFLAPSEERTAIINAAAERAEQSAKILRERA